MTKPIRRTLLLILGILIAVLVFYTLRLDSLLTLATGTISHPSFDLSAK